MQTWVWVIIGVVPVLAAGTAYAMGAFSTDIPAIDKQIAQTREEQTAFTGDFDQGGRRKRTKKSKSKHKKTNRRK